MADPEYTIKDAIVEALTHEGHQLDEVQSGLLKDLEGRGLSSVEDVVMLDKDSIKEEVLHLGLRGKLLQLRAKWCSDATTTASSAQYQSERAEKQAESLNTVRDTTTWKNRNAYVVALGYEVAEREKNRYSMLPSWFEEYKTRVGDSHRWTAEDLSKGSHMLFLHHAQHIQWQLYGAEAMIMAQQWVDCWYRGPRPEDFSIKRAVLYQQVNCSKEGAEGKKYDARKLRDMLTTKFHKMGSIKSGTHGPTVPVPDIPSWANYLAAMEKVEPAIHKCESMKDCMLVIDPDLEERVAAVYQDKGGTQQREMNQPKPNKPAPGKKTNGSGRAKQRKTSATNPKATSSGAGGSSPEHSGKGGGSGANGKRKRKAEEDTQAGDMDKFVKPRRKR